VRRDGVGDAQDVGDRVLAVAVGAHDVVVRVAGFDVGEPLLERAALAAVRGVRPERGCRAEDGRVPRAAAVVHDDDGSPRGLLVDLPHEGEQLLARFVGGHEDRH
jgi:hypothetical protein